MPQKTSSMIGRQKEPDTSTTDGPTQHELDGALAADSVAPDPVVPEAVAPEAVVPEAETPRSQADVMRHVLSLRQEAERHLSESVQVRQAALTEAELTLDSAEEAAELLQAQAQEHADAIMREARDHAATLVESARVEADEVRAEATRDLERIRQEKQVETAAAVEADFSALAETATDLSQEISVTYAALREALEQARRASSDAAARLEQLRVPAQVGATAPDDDGSASAGRGSALDEIHDDVPHPDGAPPAEAVLVDSDDLDEPVVIEELDVIDEAAPTDDEPDDEPDDELDGGPEGDLDDGYVDEPTPRPVHAVDRTPTPAPSLRSESHESARPLGWLFRQPQQ